MDNLFLYNKLVRLPEPMKAEMSDFIDFLLNKAKKNIAVNASMDSPSAKFGSGKGTFITVSDDFDVPLEDFKDYMPS